MNISSFSNVNLDSKNFQKNSQILFTGKTQVVEKQISSLFHKYEGSVLISVKKDLSAKIAKQIINHPKNIMPFLVTGESASGKTTVVKKMVAAVKNAFHVNMDNFYKDLSNGKPDRFDELINAGYSFDTPNAINQNLFISKFKQLTKRCKTKLPLYKYGYCKSIPDAETASTKKTSMLFGEGVFALHKSIRRKINDAISIYIQVPDAIIKTRWFKRAKSRLIGDEVAEKNFKEVKAKAKQFIKPTRFQSDIVLNGRAPEKLIKSFIRELDDIINQNR